MMQPVNRNPKRVALVGSGCWGSAMAKIIGRNVLEYPDKFHPEVLMYVYEEIVNGKKLTDIINMDHENIKYLPETKLPANVLAVPDVVRACTNADILVFVMPHQFVQETCKKIVVKRSALAVSLIKGFIIVEGVEGFRLVSKVITEHLNVPTAVVSGANLATECACEMFSETTIAVENPGWDSFLLHLFGTSYFRPRIVRNLAAVEACGAVKNVIGVGAGLVDGLGFGDNTKAAVFRLGLKEMIEFIKLFLNTQNIDIEEDFDDFFFESCGIADLISTCQGGRNRLLGEAIIKSLKKRGMVGVDIRMLEKEILRGQSFQGPILAREIYLFLRRRGLIARFPLLVGVHRVCTREVDPRNFLDCLREHPEHLPQQEESPKGTTTSEESETEN